MTSLDWGEQFTACASLNIPSFDIWTLKETSLHGTDLAKSPKIKAVFKEEIRVFCFFFFASDRIYTHDRDEHQNVQRDAKGNRKPCSCQLGKRLKFTPAHPNWIIKAWKMLPGETSLHFWGAIRAWSKQRESMILFPFTYCNAPECCCWRPPRQPQPSHADTAPSSRATHRAEITSRWFGGQNREF